MEDVYIWKSTIDLEVRQISPEGRSKVRKYEQIPNGGPEKFKSENDLIFILLIMSLRLLLVHEYLQIPY